MVSHDRHTSETHDDLKMVSLPHVDVVDASIVGTGALQGILTGVVAGGIIWLAIVAVFVF